MTVTYTFDVFCSLDGSGAAGGDWNGYWGKQGPELLDHRLALYDVEQRMVFGANTYRAFARMLASSAEEAEVRPPGVARAGGLGDRADPAVVRRVLRRAVVVEAHLLQDRELDLHELDRHPADRQLRLGDDGRGDQTTMTRRVTRR